MYCDECNSMLRCCAIDASECKNCGKEFINFMCPPYDDYCEECAEKLGVCRLCGEEIRRSEDR